MSDIHSESEADTRANRIDPVLHAAGWGGADAPIRREVIAPGRIVQGAKRANPMSADYVLHHRDQKLAVIEAKRAGRATAEGVGQAKEYARRLNAPFAYATNGLTWYEIDMNGGEREIATPPSPQTLWHRAYPAPNPWRDRFGAVPFADAGGKWQARYYQHNATSAVLEAIAQNQRRILLTLATGTGNPASRSNCAGNCSTPAGTCPAHPPAAPASCSLPTATFWPAKPITLSAHSKTARGCALTPR